MNPRIKALVDFAERTGLGGGRMSYQEAVDLGRLAEWWRNVALHLFETFREELRQYDGDDAKWMLSDAEVDAAEHPEHEERCGDS